MMDTLRWLTPLCGRSVVCVDQRRGRVSPPPLNLLPSPVKQSVRARSARQRSRGLPYKQADLDTDSRIDSRNSSSASVEDVLPLAPNLATRTTMAGAPPPYVKICVSSP